VTDQGGGRLHPKSQCGRLVLGRWNHVTAPLGPLAGKQISRLDLDLDSTGPAAAVGLPRLRRSASPG
jgi:hypothetical protein